MALIIVALLLFAGLIGCWLVLPGQAPAAAQRYESEPAGSIAAQQLA